jgi:hypothetical protein
MKGLIERIEIKITSSAFNEVMLAEYSKGRRIEHTYHAVPKKVVMKLLNASKNPTISDFDGWVKDEDEAQSKRNNNNVVPSGCCIEGCEWFSS